MVKKTLAKRSTTRLSPYVRGVIFGLFLAGYTYQEIAEEVEKPDGTNPCQQTVAGVVEQAQQQGGLLWDGEHSTSGGPGRPRITTDALDKKIVELVFKHRGSALVTIEFIKKKIKAARNMASRTLKRRLGDAGLAWLRRRRKYLVPAQHKVARLDWAAWTLARQAATLARWAFTDGTVFFLARDASELESKKRAALGPHVWRMADGSDGLFEDCVGPSAYHKAQGIPVKIWGLLVAGVLFVTVLPEGENMNRHLYAKIISQKFPAWLTKALGKKKVKQGAFLLQDHEKCLWTHEAREAMETQGIELLFNFPKCSQDLNPIEICWRELRVRLHETEPDGFETRDVFIRRVRSAVAWLNIKRRPYFKYLCTAQKEWARDVQAAKPPGSRTKH